MICVQISMAYEARAHFPNSTIHITNEIIHNPQVRYWIACLSIFFLCTCIDLVYLNQKVNNRLREMDVKFLEKLNTKEAQGPPQKNYAAVQEGDVVILPAFGATIQEMQLLDQKYVYLYCVYR